jgi:hypothetical protein
MAYRDVAESLRSYRARVARDLDDAHRAVREAAVQAAKVRVLEKELAETDVLLAKMGARGSRERKRLVMLDDVRIAAPCEESWAEMKGDEHVRSCGRCEKNVYNLGSLPRDKAEALLVARNGTMCVRLFRRVDGTVMTGDCPVGVRQRRQRRVAVAAVGAGLVAAAAALGLDRPSVQPMTGFAIPVPTDESWSAGQVAVPQDVPTEQARRSRAMLGK